MADSDDELEARPSTLGGLRYSIGTLFDEFGRATPAVATIINATLAALGGAVYLAADGWVAFVGAVWAILHILAILRWVITG